MYCVTIEYAQKHFEEIIERAKHEPEGVLIVQDNKSFVLINKEELDSWKETEEILQEPEILSDIKQAREEYRKGETLTMEEVLGLDDE